MAFILAFFGRIVFFCPIFWRNGIAFSLNILILTHQVYFVVGPCGRKAFAVSPKTLQHVIPTCDLNIVMSVMGYESIIVIKLATPMIGFGRYYFSEYHSVMLRSICQTGEDYSKTDS